MNDSRTILIVGTFDTKGAEYAFLREQVLSRGFGVRTVNVGVKGSTNLFPVDVEADRVAAEGGQSVLELRERADRGRAIQTMSGGAAKIASELYANEEIDGVIGMGGSGGTSVVTAAMRALPVGVPKVCVSTLAGGVTASYVGLKDVVMIPSIVDVAGLNRISRIILTRAAGAVCGMVDAEPELHDDEKPVVAATMFGNTTECVGLCREQLEQSGCEVLVFHAVGSGGRTMENLVDEGLVDAVLDITTTEWADELCGGVFPAGPDRLSAPGRAGIPHLIVPGCIDMVNFDAPHTVPEKYKAAKRTFYEWNPTVTLMRTTADENRELSRIFAEKANAAEGLVAFLIPTLGFSILDAADGLFYDRAADRAFTQSLKQHLSKDIPVIEMDTPVNSPAFASKAVEMLLEMMASQSDVQTPDLKHE